MYTLTSPDGKESYGGRDPVALAYDILLKRELGEEEGKKFPSFSEQVGGDMDVDPATGLVKQKGKSGEVAEAAAKQTLGTQPSQEHLDQLLGMGWVLQPDNTASLNGLGMWIGRKDNGIKYFG